MKKTILYLLFLVSAFGITQDNGAIYTMLKHQSQVYDDTPTPPTLTTLTYNWDTAIDGVSDWFFDNPILSDGLSVSSANQTWSWNNTDTPSGNVGPTSGQGGVLDGYIYTETSGSAVSQIFNLSLNQNIDASVYDVKFDFYTNQRGQSNNVTCVVQTNENNAGWVDRGTTFGGELDVNKVASAGIDVWVSRSVDLTGLISHANTKIRLHLVLPSTGTIAHCDYGLDTFTITLTPN